MLLREAGGQSADLDLVGWQSACEQGDGKFSFIYDPPKAEPRDVTKPKGKLELPEEWLAEISRRKIPKRKSKLAQWP